MWHSFIKLSTSCCKKRSKNDYCVFKRRFWWGESCGSSGWSKPRNKSHWWLTLVYYLVALTCEIVQDDLGIDCDLFTLLAFRINLISIQVIPCLSAPYPSLKPRPHGLGFFVFAREFQLAKFGGFRNIAHGYFVDLWNQCLSGCSRLVGSRLLLNYY